MSFASNKRQGHPQKSPYRLTGEMAKDQFSVKRVGSVVLIN